MCISASLIAPFPRSSIGVIFHCIRAHSLGRNLETRVSRGTAGGRDQRHHGSLTASEVEDVGPVRAGRSLRAIIRMAASGAGRYLDFH